MTARGRSGAKKADAGHGPQKHLANDSMSCEELGGRRDFVSQTTRRLLQAAVSKRRSTLAANPAVRCVRHSVRPLAVDVESLWRLWYRPVVAEVYCSRELSRKAVAVVRQMGGSVPLCASVWNEGASRAAGAAGRSRERK